MLGSLQTVAVFLNRKERKIFCADGEHNEWIFVYHQRNNAVWESKKDVSAGGVVGSVTQKNDGHCFGVFDLNQERHIKNMFKVFKKQFHTAFAEVEDKTEREIIKILIQRKRIVLKDGFSEKTLGEFELNVEGVESLFEKASFEIKNYTSSFK